MRSNGTRCLLGAHRLNQGYTAQQAGTRIHQQLSGEELGLGQARVLLLASSQSFRENPLGLGRGRLWGPVNSTFLCSAEENGEPALFSPRPSLWCQNGSSCVLFFPCHPENPRKKVVCSPESNLIFWDLKKMSLYGSQDGWVGKSACRASLSA